jgi:hypothetical protein
LKDTVEKYVLEAMILFDEMASTKKLPVSYQTEEIVYKRETSEKLLGQLLSEYKYVETNLTNLYKNIFIFRYKDNQSNGI